MLIGSSTGAIDAKGRAFVPAKWRQDLGADFVITRGIGGCLYAMSLVEWEKLSAKLAALPLSDAKAQSINRNLSRWAENCEPDKSGRILIPQKLRELAGIEGEVTWIAMTNHVEIWATGVLDARDEAGEEDYEQTLAQAVAYGI